MAVSATAGYPTPAAFDGVQYFGEGSIFDGESSTNGKITTMVEDGTRNADTFTGGRGNDIISGGGANDTVIGWSGNDLLYGGKGNDVVLGGSGNDRVLVSSGNDVYNGGSGGNGLNGSDVLDYSLMKGNLNLSFGKHTADVGSGHAINHDTISSFETVVGTVGGVDTIRGDHNNNTFVSAGATNYFRGGLGDDTLVGGSGADTFIITKKDIADGSVKTFANFTAGQDSLDLADFMKGHSSEQTQFRFLDLTNADGSHSTMVQAQVHKQWANVVDLAGVNVNDVGADHHSMTVADLHAGSMPLAH